MYVFLYMDIYKIYTLYVINVKTIRKGAQLFNYVSNLSRTHQTYNVFSEPRNFVIISVIYIIVINIYKNIVTKLLFPLPPPALRHYFMPGL